VDKYGYIQLIIFLTKLVPGVIRGLKYIAFISNDINKIKK